MPHERLPLSCRGFGSYGLILLAGILVCANSSPAQSVAGCTDRAANNFNAAATVNDGSCTYAAATLSPSLKYTQSATLSENSGLILWNGLLWQHNDGGGAAALFATDTVSNSVLRTVTLAGATNVDWEDIAQDDVYMYIGDFGNNANGARTDLRIYRIAKSDISGSAGDITVQPQVISFTYQDQPANPSPVSANTTDFDCEAMIAYNGSLYLFTKQWTAKQTGLYELPIVPGSHTAMKLGTLNVNGLVTGADVFPAGRTLALTGYSSILARFLYLLYDFNGNAFFNGNKRKVSLSGLVQTESVGFVNMEHILIGSEASLSAQRLESVSLVSLLREYVAVLPIRKASLQAERSGSEVRLRWEVEPSSEFAGGMLERQSGAENGFTGIHGLTTANGIYRDARAAATGGFVQYRLRVWDRDGRQKTSNIAALGMPPQAGMRVGNGPGGLRVFSYGGDGIASADIYGASGRKLLSGKIEMNSGSMPLDGLPPGWYLAAVRYGSRLSCLPFIKR